MCACPAFFIYRECVQEAQGTDCQHLNDTAWACTHLYRVEGVRYTASAWPRTVLRT